jgi:hypothetical protein
MVSPLLTVVGCRLVVLELEDCLLIVAFEDCDNEFDVPVEILELVVTDVEGVDDSGMVERCDNGLVMLMTFDD